MKVITIQIHSAIEENDLEAIVGVICDRMWEIAQDCEFTKPLEYEVTTQTQGAPQ